MNHSAEILVKMCRPKFGGLVVLLPARSVLALPFSPAEFGLQRPTIFNNVALDMANKAVREDLSNSTSTSTRSSRTVFWPPQASAGTSQSSVSASLTEPPASSAHGISTVTIPWIPTATSSASVHVITITSPWPSVTPTITVPITLSATASGQSGPESSASEVSTVTNPAPTSTVEPALVTVTVTPQQPAPGAVTVIDTTVTVYISSGVLTMVPTVTVTASTPEAPEVVTVTVD